MSDAIGLNNKVYVRVLETDVLNVLESSSLICSNKSSEILCKIKYNKIHFNISYIQTYCYITTFIIMINVVLFTSGIKNWTVHVTLPRHEVHSNKKPIKGEELLHPHTLT